MSGIGTGYNPGYQSPYGSYLGAYGGPGMAKGFGPAIINKPTRILVGEAGPELVSVVPIKNKGPASKTAAAGMGWYGPAGGGLGYGGIPRTNTYAEAAYLLQQAQGGMQQGAMQGSRTRINARSATRNTTRMQQSQPGMQDAVQQGAMQGTQQGYQEVASRIQQALQQGNMAEAMAGFGTGYGFNWSGGAMGTNLGMGGGAQYPTAPSNTEIWGAGRFTWGGGAAGAQLGGGNMGGAQYPTAGVPLGPEHAIGFGSRPIKYTWGGGASGTTLTPHGPHVGEGLPGPDPYAPGGPYSQPGGGFPPGYRLPGQEGTSDAEYESWLLAERARIARERGGTSMGSTFHGISPTIMPGTGPRRQAQFGMHEFLRKDTLIQAHRNERVDISPHAEVSKKAASCKSQLWKESPIY